MKRRKFIGVAAGSVAAAIPLSKLLADVKPITKEDWTRDPELPDDQWKAYTQIGTASLSPRADLTRFFIDDVEIHELISAEMMQTHDIKLVEMMSGERVALPGHLSDYATFVVRTTSNFSSMITKAHMSMKPVMVTFQNAYISYVCQAYTTEISISSRHERPQIYEVQFRGTSPIVMHDKLLELPT